MLRDHCIFYWWKKRGGFGLIEYVSNSTNLREFVCSEFVLESILEFVMKFAMKFVQLKKVLKNHGLLKFVSGPPLGGRPNENSGRP